MVNFFPFHKSYNVAPEKSYVYIYIYGAMNGTICVTSSSSRIYKCHMKLPTFTGKRKVKVVFADDSEAI